MAKILDKCQPALIGCQAITGSCPPALDDLSFNEAISSGSGFAFATTPLDAREVLCDIESLQKTGDARIALTEAPCDLPGADALLGPRNGLPFLKIGKLFALFGWLWFFLRVAVTHVMCLINVAGYCRGILLFYVATTITNSTKNSLL